MSESEFVLGQKVFYVGTDSKVYPCTVRKTYSDGFLSLDFKGCAMAVAPAQVYTEADKLVVNSLFGKSLKPVPKFKTGDCVTIDIPDESVTGEGVVIGTAKNSNGRLMYRVRLNDNEVCRAYEDEITLMTVPVESKFKVNDYVQTVNPRSRFFGRELRVAVVRDDEIRALCADGGAWFDPTDLRLSPDNGDTVTVTTRELVERCYDILTYLAAGK